MGVAMSSHPSSPATPSRCPAPWLLSTASSTSTPPSAVRCERWPMGLGKYLLSKLEESMTDKGVLQVDKVEGKPGNFVFINGRSVGLSNKLSDFSTLAAKMTMYESVLAKMTSKITAPPAAEEQKPYMVPETTFHDKGWEGN